MAGAACHSVSAVTIFQTVENIDWNSAMWGTPAAAPTAGNDYVTTSGNTRIPANTSNSTFGGDSLTVVSGSSALMKNSGSTSTINGAFNLDGGLLNLGPNGGVDSNLSGTLDVASFNVTGIGSQIQIGNAGGNLTVTSALSGTGNLDLVGANSQIVDIVSFNGLSSYSGAISLGTSGALTLGFGTSSYTFSNALTIFDTSVLQVNSGQTLTFNLGDLVDPNGAVAAGTYTGGDLNALGSNYANNGGTIVVVPEPSGAILSLLGLGSLCLVRRRR